MAQCFKCKNAVGHIPSRDGVAKPYCVDCFTEFCTKLVRDNLLMHCRLPCDVPMAVAVSGGPNSMLLLHQLGIFRRQHELRAGAGKVRFIFLPFHLCEDTLLLPPTPFSSSVNRVCVEEVRATIMEQCNALKRLVVHQASLWQFADVPLYEPDEVRIFQYSDVMNQEEISTLRFYLHHPKLSLTCREEIYESVRQKALTLLASRLVQKWLEGDFSNLGCSEGEGCGKVDLSHATSWRHLIVGSNAVRCCIAALQATVGGGGGTQVVHTSGFRGSMHNVVLLRPLRTLLPKEAIHYGRIHGIHATYTPALSTCTSLRSIYRCLEAFVLGLMSSYRAIVFNILNVVNKLEVQPETLMSIVSGGLKGREEHLPKGQRVTLGKSAQSNYMLLCATPMPDFPVRRGGEQVPGSVACCLVCGCVNAAACTDATPKSHLAITDTQMSSQLTDCDSKEGNYFLCHSCRMLMADYTTIAGRSAVTVASSPDDDTSTIFSTIPNDRCELLPVWEALAEAMGKTMSTVGRDTIGEEYAIRKAVLSDEDRAAYLMDMEE